MLNLFSVVQGDVWGSMLEESSGSSVSELRIVGFKAVNAVGDLGVTDGVVVTEGT